MDNMVSEAKRLLVTTHYSSERKGFNFERYAKIQKDQHRILEGLKEHGHVGIYPRSQVRHLIEGINITELDSVKDQITGTASLKNGYYGCVSLYKTFIDKRKKVSPPELNISGVELSNQKGGGNKKLKGNSGGAVEDV